MQVGRLRTSLNKLLPKEELATQQSAVSVLALQAVSTNDLAVSGGFSQQSASLGRARRKSVMATGADPSVMVPPSLDAVTQQHAPAKQSGRRGSVVPHTLDPAALLPPSSHGAAAGGGRRGSVLNLNRSIDALTEGDLQGAPKMSAQRRGSLSAGAVVLQPGQLATLRRSTGNMPDRLPSEQSFPSFPPRRGSCCCGGGARRGSTCGGLPSSAAPQVRSAGCCGARRGSTFAGAGGPASAAPPISPSPSAASFANLPGAPAVDLEPSSSAPTMQLCGWQEETERQGSFS